ncbi:MAG TPA: four-carbon acid sugar kinase family protein [Verrucomicrobiae bacterium]|nr:four-carbon acid sugar kinase family protein [Verrucomicrobiae bacterium]
MIGVIADDLSGAAEIGALGLRHGLTSEIVTHGTRPGRADLVCIDTDSRSRTASDAVERNRDAARVLQAAGAEWIYKKVDSVLRGHVAAELHAVMDALACDRALLVPANPSRKRIVRGGKYYIDGRPIDQTEFAHDPEYPRNTARVVDLLGPARQGAMRVFRQTDPLVGNGIGIGEASKLADLKVWAGRLTPGIVAAGAAEFFAALLEARGFPERSETAELERCDEPRRELFVCGTASRSGREFVRASRLRKVPIFSLPSELVWGADFSELARLAVARRAAAACATSLRVILHVGLPNMRRPEAARMLTEHLVRLAELVLGLADVTSVYAEGGATAAALMQRMGWTRLKVMSELAPGVARLAAGKDGRIWLTVKPGSYAWPAAVRKGAALACGRVA